MPHSTPSVDSSPVEVLRFLISNGLSYGVVFGASILKVPQILNVVRHRSAEGVSVTANYVELLSYVVSTSWGISQGLNFRDYGENFFIFVQLLVLVVLVATMQRHVRTSLVVLSAELLVFYALSKGAVPRGVHELMLQGQVLLNITSRVPQILLNARMRSTGQLSFLTFFLAFGGALSRVLTTTLNVPWEKGKGALLRTYGVAAFLNFVLIAQILYYRKRQRTPPTKRKQR